MTVGDAAAVREALRRTPSLAQRVAAMDAFDRIEREVEQLQQERDDARAMYEAKRALEDHLYERLDAARAEAGKLRDEALAAVYRENPTLVARVCDEQLDKRGALLGRVRALAGSDAPPTLSEAQ